MSRVVGHNNKVIERRQRRLIIPIVYFLAELTVLWLILTLIQLNFYPTAWDVWAILVFMIGGVYSLIKTVHVYQRQKVYPKADNEWKGLKE